MTSAPAAVISGVTSTSESDQFVHISEKDEHEQPLASTQPCQGIDNTILCACGVNRIIRTLFLILAVCCFAATRDEIIQAGDETISQAKRRRNETAAW
jgi:hypothetical protein